MTTPKLSPMQRYAWGIVVPASSTEEREQGEGEVRWYPDEDGAIRVNGRIVAYAVFENPSVPISPIVRRSSRTRETPALDIRPDGCSILAVLNGKKKAP